MFHTNTIVPCSFPPSILQHYEPEKYLVTNVETRIGGTGQQFFVVNYFRMGKRWIAVWKYESGGWVPETKCIGEEPKERIKRHDTRTV